MRKSTKRLQLNRETMRLLNLTPGLVAGGGSIIFSCDPPTPESRGFSNCTYCNGNTKWRTDCTEI